jgi:hypothetical protein
MYIKSRLITYKNIYFKNPTGTARIKSGAEIVCRKNMPIQLHNKR